MPIDRTLIHASHIIAFDGTRHRYLKDGVVVYKGDTIIYVGKKFDGTIDHLIDATNKVVTPGFIDTHIHMAGSPLDKSFIEDHGKRNFYNSGLFEMLPARSAAQTRHTWSPAAQGERAAGMKPVAGCGHHQTHGATGSPCIRFMQYVIDQYIFCDSCM